jgi:hypothetical protein
MASKVKKAWVIQEIGWEYNDEYYYRAESRGGIARRVYFDHDAAVIDCARMNAGRVKSMPYTMEDRNSTVIKEFYELVEVEVM